MFEHLLTAVLPLALSGMGAYVGVKAALAELSARMNLAEKAVADAHKRIDNFLIGGGRRT